MKHTISLGNISRFIKPSGFSAAPCIYTQNAFKSSSIIQTNVMLREILGILRYIYLYYTAAVYETEAEIYKHIRHTLLL